MHRCCSFIWTIWNNNWNDGSIPYPAVTGGGDAKAMAGGVARSTIPAMAGLFASIPALLALRSIDQAAKKNIEILTERLTYDKKFDVI